MDSVEQLNRIFHPGAVAVVGASAVRGKMGFRCMESLLKAGFKGNVYPVNPGSSELFGLRAYPSVSALPDGVDLAVIAIPARLTVPVIEECVSKGIKGAVLVTSGYKEVSSEGLDLQDRIRDIANNGNMKIIGPNTIGLVNPEINLNATFVPSLGSVKSGGIAVASQSGGMLHYMLNTLMDYNMGISKATGLGNRCNLDFDEVVDYFAGDDETRVIILYIEGVEDPRKLIDVAGRVVKRKPVIVYKAGRSEESNQASLSHTGTLAGNYEFYRAAFTQAGIIPIHNIIDLVDSAKALDLQTPSPGNRVAIISIQAGPGITMADRCRELGLRLAEFSPVTRERLRQLVSSLGSINNPVDLAGRTSGNFDIYRSVLEVLMQDEAVDFIAASVTDIDPDDDFTRAMLEISGRYRKPAVVSCPLSFTGEGGMMMLAEVEKKRVPVYTLPERAITGLAALARYGAILKRIG